MVSFAMLAACSTSTPRPEKPAAQSWPPLSPTSLGAERSAAQVLRAAYGGRDVTLNAMVEVKKDRLTVVGLTALGMRAFSVSYDGQQVRAERAPQVPEQLQPGQLLNDLQLVFWPLAILQEALAPAGWQVTEPAPGTRRLRRDGRLIAEVHHAGADPWQGRAWLVNFDLGYSLSIESRPVGEPGVP